MRDHSLFFFSPLNIWIEIMSLGIKFVWTDILLHLGILIFHLPFIIVNVGQIVNTIATKN